MLIKISRIATIATIFAVVIFSGYALAQGTSTSGKSDDLKAMLKATSIARDWYSLKLDSYGDHKITYKGDPITIRYTSHVPELSAPAVIAKKGFAVLEKMSKGKIKVNMRFNGVIHSLKEGVVATRSGVTDMTAVFSYLHASDFPLTSALTLPGIFPNEGVMVAVIENLAEKYFRPEFERQGVYFLFTLASAPFNIFSKKPITTLDDLQGLKIRTDAGITREIFRALGATPVVLSGKDLYTTLQRGLIDAVDVPDFSAARVYRLHEISTDVTVTPINMVPLDHCLNPQTYEALPADLQRVFYDWARQSSQAGTQVISMLTAAKAKNDLIKQGIIYHKIAPEEWKRWQEKWAPVVDDFIKEGEKRGLPTRQLVADMRRLVEKYRNMSPNELMTEAINNPAKGVFPVKEN